MLLYYLMLQGLTQLDRARARVCEIGHNYQPTFLHIILHGQLCDNLSSQTIKGNHFAKITFILKKISHK